LSIASITLGEYGGGGLYGSDTYSANYGSYGYSVGIHTPTSPYNNTNTNSGIGGSQTASSTHGTQLTSLQQNTSTQNTGTQSGQPSIKLPTIKEMMQDHACATGWHRVNGICVENATTIHSIGQDIIQTSNTTWHPNTTTGTGTGTGTGAGTTTTGTDNTTNTGTDNTTNTDTDNTNTGTGTGAGTGGTGTGVTCKDGTRGNGTSTPCAGHGGIAGAGTGTGTGTSAVKNYLPIAILGVLVIGYFAINKVLKS
jgi:hypothetical protein